MSTITQSTRNGTVATSAASRHPLFAVVGAAFAAGMCAIATFWDVNNNDAEPGKLSEYLIVVGVIVATTAIVYGLVVRGAEQGHAGRRAVILGMLGLLTVVGFWSGVPIVLAAASVTTGLIDRDLNGRFGTAAKIALALAPVTLVLTVWLDILG